MKTHIRRRIVGIAQGVYWLSLGIWVGSLVMLAVAAAITFSTSRSLEPKLLQPQFNTPDLSGQSANIVAGAIVGNVISGLLVVQLVCAALVFVTLVLQHTLMRPLIHSQPRLNQIRILLIALPTLVLLVTAGYITPAMWRERQTMYNPDTTVELRQDARRRFDQLHKFSSRATGTSAIALVIAGLASGMIFASGRPPRPAKNPSTES